ncbi:hypothetical protein EDB83DRAFT_2337956 [Lactarius deliciosus]|nr:hypothetical protein EDB83DRAFT_2337956 [Lactarius deliciosus]
MPFFVLVNTLRTLASQPGYTLGSRLRHRGPPPPTDCAIILCCLPSSRVDPVLRDISGYSSFLVHRAGISCDRPGKRPPNVACLCACDDTRRRRARYICIGRCQ